MNLKISQIIKALGTNFIASESLNAAENKDKSIVLVSTDSRKTTEESQLFIALKGLRSDDTMLNAHNFATYDNLKAAFAIISEPCPALAKEKTIMVKDTIKAYGQIANLYRKSFKGKVIAITGSSGKTSTKLALKSILETYGKVYSTPQNLNSQLGVPKCLIEMTEEEYDFAIIEAGMSKPGEMLRLGQIIQPDIAVVINVHPMHIENFKNGISEIAHEKAELFKGLQKDGIAIYNIDSNESKTLQTEAKKHIYRNFGKNINACIRAEKIEGTKITAKVFKKTLSYQIPENNTAFLYNTLCAICICNALELKELKAATKVFAELEATDGRGAIKHLSVGKATNSDKTPTKMITVIDESYSGGFSDAMIMGLERVKSRKNESGRKIIILGNMAELGDLMEEEHRKVGKVLKYMKIDKLYLIGEPTKWIFEELPEYLQKITERFETVEPIMENLDKIFENNDLVFIKGAHNSSQVWKIVKKLEDEQK